jgi:hypothetical protein
VYAQVVSGGNVREADGVAPKSAEIQVVEVFISITHLGKLDHKKNGVFTCQGYRRGGGLELYIALVAEVSEIFKPSISGKVAVCIVVVE